MIHSDRRAAGDELTRVLDRLGASADVVVGLARGGLIVAERVASHLRKPLGVAVVSVIHATGLTRTRLGAAAADGSLWVDENLVRSTGLESLVLERESASAITRARWLQRQLGPAARTPLSGRDVLLVDEALAWSGRALAAARWARRRGAARIALAVPAATPAALERLSHEVDWILTLGLNESFADLERVYRCLPPVDMGEIYAIAQERKAPRRSRRLRGVARALAPWRRLALAC